MTGAALELKIRSILRDNSEGRATGSRRFETQDLQIALVKARMDAFKMLLDASRERPPVAFIQLAQAGPASDGAALPGDYYDLECGMDSDGRYLVAEHVDIGDTFHTSEYEYVYATAGVFRGGATLAEAITWRLPTIIVSFSIGGPVLDDLPDSFYEALKYAAIRDVLKKEYGDHIERWKFFDELYKRAVGSFAE